MKKSLILSIGLMLVAAIGYSADLTEVKKNLKEDIVNTIDAIRTDVTTSEIVAIKYAVIDEINAARVLVDASTLNYEYVLDAGAQSWCMQLDDGNFRHDQTKSTGPFKGEAILSYEGDLRPERIVAEFLASLPHRQILLDNFTLIGVGIKRVGNNNFVVVRLE